MRTTEMRILFHNMMTWNNIRSLTGELMDSRVHMDLVKNIEGIEMHMMVMKKLSVNMTTWFNIRNSIGVETNLHRKKGFLTLFRLR
jgi:hypothetical protein